MIFICVSNIYMNIEHTYVLYVSEKELVRAKYKFDDYKNVEYFKGVVGAKDPAYKTYYNNYYSVKNNNKIFLKPGEFGHIQSFINILNDAKNKKYDTITIFEPDVYFCKQYNEKYTELIQSVSMDNVNWDILYLGSMQGFYYGKPTWTEIDKNINKHNKYYNAHKSLATFALMIKRNMFDTIIDSLSKLNEPTDVVLCTIQDTFNCIVAYPNLVCSDISSSGTNKLQSPKNQVEYMKKYRWDPSFYDFNDCFPIPNSSDSKIVINVNSKLNNDSSIIIKTDTMVVVTTINDPIDNVTIDRNQGNYIFTNNCFINSIK